MSRIRYKVSNNQLIRITPMSRIKDIRGKMRVAQQKRFLEQRKKLQFKQFRTQQKLQLQKQRTNILRNKAMIRRLRQQQMAGRMAKLRKAGRTARKVSRSFGLRW